MSFKISPNADSTGTSLKGSFCTNYRQLVKLFGHPEDGDNYKVSGLWTFEHTSGDVVTLYDWKATSLYDPFYPSVEDFRTMHEYEWHIGGHSSYSAHEFINWLNKKIG